MSRSHDAEPHDDVLALDSLPEPVRRYLRHALVAGVAPSRVLLAMAGRINVGRWLDFTAEQRLSAQAFSWRARAGWGPLKPLHVVDSYGDGRGEVTVGWWYGTPRFEPFFEATILAASLLG